MQCQAHRDPEATCQYTQSRLKVLLDGHDPRWRLVEVRPKSTLASDGHVKRTETDKSVLQQAMKLAIKLNPFSSGANLEATRTKERSTANEVIINKSRIIQKQGLGTVWWDFHVDDEYAVETGLGLAEGTLPFVDMDFMRDRKSSNLAPHRLTVEISSFWSLIRNNGLSAWLTYDAGGSLPPAFSNLCQVVCWDLLPTLDDNGNYVATINVGASSKPLEKLTVHCENAIEASAAVPLRGDVELGKAVDTRFVGCRGS